MHTYLNLVSVLSHILQSARSFTTAILIFMRPFLCNASPLSGNVILGFPVTFKCKNDLSSLRYVLNYFIISAICIVMSTFLLEHGT